MKAKNPHGDGYVDAYFPSGPSVQLWVKVCKDCGSPAGGCFSGPVLPEPKIGERSVCPGCGGSNLRLELVES